MCFNTMYTSMIRQAEGLPVVLTPSPATEVEALLDRLVAAAGGSSA